MAFWTALAAVFCLVSLSEATDFEYLTFSQQWPRSICIGSRPGVPCVVKSDVKTWTIHGLWATNRHSRYPVHCKRSARFDPGALSVIHDDLERYWPNVYPTTKSDSMWKHEWCAHGTCLEMMPCCRTELRYFQKSLSLNRELDLLRMLDKAGIVPSKNKTYNYTDILAAVGGPNVSILCFVKEPGGEQYLIDVHICMSKNFKKVPCKPMNFAEKHPLFWLNMTTLDRHKHASCGRDGVVLPGSVRKRICSAEREIVYPLSGTDKEQ